jgi:hypothetical protein
MKNLVYGAEVQSDYSTWAYMHYDFSHHDKFSFSSAILVEIKMCWRGTQIIVQKLWVRITQDIGCWVAYTIPFEL